MKALRPVVVIVVVVFFVSEFGVGPGIHARQQPDARIAALIAALDTRNWDQAVDQLVALGPQATGQLLATLGRREGLAAARACIALAKIGTPQAIDAVLEATRSPDRRIREHAAEGLGFVRTEESFDALVTALASDTGLVQSSAARSLGHLGNPRAAGPLAAALKGGAWYVRTAAATSLGRIKSRDGVRPLIDALGDERSEVRNAAREALVAFGRNVVPLAAEALDHTSGLVRSQVAWLLGRVGTAETTEALLAAIQDSDAAVRYEAAVALVRVASRGVVVWMCRFLKHANPGVREEAAWVLGEIGDAESVDDLVRALRLPDSGWMAALALGSIQAQTAAPRLAEALASGSPALRRASAWALNKLRSRETVPQLRRALSDGDFEVRYWASEALGGIGTPEARHALAEAKPPLRRTAVSRCAPPRSPATIVGKVVLYRGRRYPLYPATLAARPAIPSPLVAADGTELVVAVLSNRRYGIFRVTLKGEAAKDRQCNADARDFPTLARTGLHSEVELDRARSITGRSVTEITRLARPGELSDDGFLGADEELVAVIRADNRTVSQLGLTHADLARPLFHIWNMMRIDLDLNRWNMAEHQWNNVTALLSHGRTVKVEAHDSKGGQRSIFDDGLDGGFRIDIAGTLSDKERAFLATHYPALPPTQIEALVQALTRVQTGELEPHYIMWYGFYEGRTPWRADPITVAFVFGLRTLEQIEAAFPGQLHEVLRARRAAQVERTLTSPNSG